MALEEIYERRCRLVVIFSDFISAIQCLKMCVMSARSDMLVLSVKQKIYDLTSDIRFFFS